MKIIRYYSALLIFLFLLCWFLYSENVETMDMPKMIMTCIALAGYVILLSLIGEGKQIDEREGYHRSLANRGALIVGTSILSIGIIYQLFHHQLDYWLLSALIGMNVVKIVMLLYLENKK